MEKYTIQEIDAMRDICECLVTPNNDSYNTKEIAKKTEMTLRTYMQNGTTVEELQEYLNVFEANVIENEKRMTQAMAEYQKTLPPEPPRPKTSEEVIERWFSDCVAKYANAMATSDELFDGFMGLTLSRYANRHAPDGVFVTKRQMERFLDGKGIRSRRAGFFGGKTYDGIRHIIHGNVRHGSYGT